MARPETGDLERRAVVDLEWRDAADPNVLRFAGYATTYNSAYPMYGGPPIGWTERVAPGAFDETLSSGVDVRLLVNHDGLPLARTTSGTLRLSSDATGLLVEADLDARDPDVAAIRYKLARGDLNEMSFAFRATGEDWSDDDTERTLTGVSLADGDVSIVTYPANPATIAAIRAMVDHPAGRVAMDRLAADRAGDLVELRAATRAASGASGLPLSARDAAWDGPAAAKRVAAWASGDGSGDKATIDFGRYGRAFFWTDGDGSNLGDYRLGFADVIDGKLSAVWRGVTAVAAVLQGARGGVKGIPDSGIAAIKTRVEGYYVAAAKAYDDSSITAPWKAANSRRDAATIASALDVCLDELGAFVDSPLIDAANALSDALLDALGAADLPNDDDDSQDDAASIPPGTDESTPQTPNDPAHQPWSGKPGLPPVVDTDDDGYLVTSVQRMAAASWRRRRAG